MLNKRFIIFILLFFILRNGFAQTQCNDLGQNPGTAFPVCGTDTFSIASVAICGDKKVPNPPACTAVQFTDKNPYWYKFTCFT
ncbi:MAG: PKD domain-containing protein, partial [Ferruginibacter sp.]